MGGEGKNIVWFLYWPYLITVALAVVVSGLFSLTILALTENMPVENTGFIFPTIILTFALLATYRPIVNRITSRWSHRAQGLPVDILLALPTLFFSQGFIHTIWYGEPEWAPNFAFYFVWTTIVCQGIWLLCLRASSARRSAAEIYLDLNRAEVIAKAKNEFSKTFEYVLPTKHTRFTIYFSYFLFAYFIVMMLSGVSGLMASPQDLETWGSANMAMIRVNQPWQDWRLITSMFVNKGIFQLCCVLFVLIVLGRAIEPIIGSLGTALMFATSSLGANLIAFEFDANSHIASSNYGSIGIAIALMCYALFEIGDENNRERFFMSGVGGGLIAILVNHVLIEGLGRTAIPFKPLIGALAGGFVAGMFYLSRVKRAPEFMGIKKHK